MKFSKILITICCSISILTTANAAIVSTSGSISYITAPSSVYPGAYESSDSITSFDEQQNVILSSDLSVDYLSSTGSTGTLSTGTQINSYFVHFDPIGTSVEAIDRITLAGSLTFSEQIIGLIYTGLACPLCPVTPQNLEASDYLGQTGTIYPTDGLGRGLEPNSDPYYTGRGDLFTLSADGLTLDLQFTAYPLRTDQLRVITASTVPIPAAAYLFVSGLLGIGIWGRKKKKAKI